MEKIIFTDHTCLEALYQKVNEILNNSDTVMIIIKPTLQTTIDICEKFDDLKNRILFCFQINGMSTPILQYFDPYSPYFIERFTSLKYAFLHGFKTSVEIDPIIDNMIVELIQKIEEYVTDFIFIEKIKNVYNYNNNNQLTIILHEIKKFYDDNENLKYINQMLGKNHFKIQWGENFKTDFLSIL